MCKLLYAVGTQRDSFGVHIAHSFVHIVCNSLHATLLSTMRGSSVISRVTLMSEVITDFGVLHPKNNSTIMIQ